MNHLIHIAFRGKTVWTAIALSCLFTATLPTAFAESVRTIYYSGAAAPTDKRADYYLKLLDLALGKTGTRYELHPNGLLMSHQRALSNLNSNDGIDIFWGPTTREMEQRFLPIRIPIDKGILGWRIFLIKTRDRHLFEEIHSLKQLQSYTAGQPNAWADTEILRANGLKVAGTEAYETMFEMLAADRFQYFPRGVGEVWNEASGHGNLGLEVEQHLALHYPANTYFFVNQSTATLARIIERGLRAAIGDGSLDKLFEQFYGESIKRAHLNARTIVELGNPLLPDEPPMIRNNEVIYR